VDDELKQIFRHTDW